MPSVTKVSAESILNDLRAGLRTREFLAKYGLDKSQFEQILKKLLRDRLFTREEYYAWKARKSGQTSASSVPETVKNVETYVIQEPEKNSAWALELFSTDRDRIAGVTFKANLHGRKYAFTVERMVFRGSVKLLGEGLESSATQKKKREEAMNFITEHGWAAYLESRAIAANFEEEESNHGRKGRLVILKCRNETYVAALHTPVPSVNLYVGQSLSTIRERLGKTADLSNVNPA
jgi:hypothetical protein